MSNLLRPDIASSLWREKPDWGALAAIERPEKYSRLHARPVVILYHSHNQLAAADHGGRLERMRRAETKRRPFRWSRAETRPYIETGKLKKPGRNTETLSRDEVCSRLEKLLGQRGIQKFILFGSFARNIQTADSDIDLIVVVDTDKRFFDRYDDILLFLHNALRPHAVSPLIYTPKELKKMRERPFGIVPTALKEGIEIDVKRKE